MTTFKFIRPSNILDAGGTFTRSTTATYFDIDGVMQTAAIDVPRIGYDPVTHAHTGLILEAAATNLLTYSEQFDNAAWIRFGTTTSVTANNATGRDGTSFADTVSLTSASSGCYQARSASAATTYTGSIWMRVASARTVNLVLNTNLSDPVTLGCAVTPTWQRFSLSKTTSVGTTSLTVQFQDSGAGNTVVEVWGAQLETGTTPTSYIPTTTVAVTRGADTATGSGLIYTDVPEADYAAWVGGTTYTADTDYVIRTTAATHKVYLCLVTHTLAATPEDNLTGATPKWLEIGPTNRWKIFDQKVGTTTTQADSMTYLLKPGRANSLALLGVDASSVEVSLVADGETVYTASFDLDSGNSVGDWYEYFYEPIYQTDSVVVTNLLDTTLFDLPQYGDGVLCVRFLRDGGDVTCGVLVAGAYAELGQTLSDPTIGIIDYSRKSTDDFGNTTIVARTYSKRMSCSMLVGSSSVDNVSRLLAQYRSTPVVWVAADNIFTSMIVYGFYKDWEVRIESPNHSTCNIQIEGLT